MVTTYVNINLICIIYVYFHLRRLGSQQTNRQIYLKFVNMICLTINSHTCMVKKKNQISKLLIWTFSYVYVQLSKGGKQARSGHNHPVILKITIFVVNLDKMVLGYSATITTFTIYATTSTAFTTSPHLIPEKDALDIIRAKSNNKIKRLLPNVWLLFWPLYS